MSRCFELSRLSYVAILMASGFGCAPSGHQATIAPYGWTVSKPGNGSVTVKAPAYVGTPFIKDVYLRAMDGQSIVAETIVKYDYHLPVEATVGDAEHPVLPTHQIKVSAGAVGHTFFLQVPSE